MCVDVVTKSREHGKYKTIYMYAMRAGSSRPKGTWRLKNYMPCDQM